MDLLEDKKKFHINIDLQSCIHLTNLHHFNKAKMYVIHPNSIGFIRVKDIHNYELISFVDYLETMDN